MSSTPLLHHWLSLVPDSQVLPQARRLQAALQQCGVGGELWAAAGAEPLPAGVGPFVATAVGSAEPWLLHVASAADWAAAPRQQPHAIVLHGAPDPAVLAAIAAAPACLTFDAGLAAALRTAGARRVVVLPLYEDIGPSERPWDRALAQRLRERLTVVAPGPTGDGMATEGVLAAFAELTHFLTQPARLVVVGGTATAAVRAQLQPVRWGLEADDSVLWLPEPVAADVEAVLRCSELCVSLDADPAVRALLAGAVRHDVPVLAQAAPATAGWLDAGLLLDPGERDPRVIAAAWHVVLTEPGVRQRVLRGQRQCRAAWQPEQLAVALAPVLEVLQVACAPQAPVPAASRWRVEGPVGSTYSLAIVNRHLAAALAQTEVTAGLRRVGEDDHESAEWEWLRQHDPATVALAERDLAWRAAGQTPDVALRFHYPPWVDGMQGAVRVVHSYGWEETAFPEPYVAAFNRRLDGITTLATEVSKALRDSGVRLPMVAVGTGVDHVLHEAPEPLELTAATRQAGFRFLHVSSCFPRKGPDVLLAAWGQAFRASDDVVLMIKTFPNPHNDVAEQLAAWRRRDPEYPAVEIISRDVSQGQMNWLYRYSDALVAPSRGEGFGMPMAEAMLFDLPVLVTGWGGQTDFCTDDTAWLCDFQFAYSGSHLGVPHSAWAEPSVAHLASLMREVWQMPPEQRQVRTRRARERVLRDYSWAAVARRTQAAVARFAAPPLLRVEPRIAWVSTWNVRCGIANYSRSLLQAFAPERVTLLALPGGELEADDESWVVRCDPEALGRDPAATLLAEVDRLGLDVLVLQYNFGFFSLEAMADLLEGLDARGVTAYVFLHSTDDAGRVSLASIAPALRLAERLVVHSVVDLNRLKTWGLADKVLLFPHGVPETPAPPTEAVRAARGLAGKRVVASYGFLLPHKGMQILIRAFADLARHDPSLHLVLVCALYPNPKSTQEHADCERLIAALGLDERITRIHDFLPDAESLSWLQLADLVVFPYQYTQESSSAAVRGGLAAGRPVAVTPLAIFDDVADGVSLLPGTDAAAIADGMRRLLADADALEALRQKGVRWCDARRWSRVSVRLLNLIDGVANDLA